MRHLLSECSPGSIIAEDRLLHELALLPSKNRVVQRNPLNLGFKIHARRFNNNRIMLICIMASLLTVNTSEGAIHWAVEGSSRRTSLLSPIGRVKTPAFRRQL